MNPLELLAVVVALAAAVWAAAKGRWGEALMCAFFFGLALWLAFTSP